LILYVRKQFANLLGERLTKVFNKQRTPAHKISDSLQDNALFEGSVIQTDPSAHKRENI